MTLPNMRSIASGLVASSTGLRTGSLLRSSVRHQLGVSPDDAERQDFAPDFPRGNAICRMVDASEIAFVAVFPASDKVWAVSGELVAATGGAGRTVFTKRRSGRAHPIGRPGPPRRLCLGRRRDPGAADARSRPSRRHERASRPARSSPHLTTLCRYSRPEVRHLPWPPAD